MFVLELGGRLVGRIAANGFHIWCDLGWNRRTEFGRRFSRRRGRLVLMRGRGGILRMIRVVIAMVLIVMTMLRMMILAIVVFMARRMIVIAGFDGLVRLHVVAVQAVVMAGVVVGRYRLRGLLAFGDLDHLALHAFATVAAA
jgi:hypothetical protein